ncbi:MAG: MT-A70 family methyltransferase [Lentisphaeria bacterium]
MLAKRPAGLSYLGIPNYQVLLVDPPWTYRDSCSAGKRGAVYKYPTLTLGDLRELRVREWAAEDSLLFLWATWPLLPDALTLMESWGFLYKTIAFVWAKTRGPVQESAPPRWHWGMGNWTRSNTEICLLGVSGRPKRASGGVHQLVVSPLRAHSAKPPEVRERIVRLVGEDVPKVELFARERAPGWDACGLELDGLDVRDYLGSGGCP